MQFRLRSLFLLTTVAAVYAAIPRLTSDGQLAAVLFLQTALVALVVFLWFGPLRRRKPLLFALAGGLCGAVGFAYANHAEPFLIADRAFYSVLFIGLGAAAGGPVGVVTLGMR